MLSILTPAFNESANLEELHARLVQTMATLGGDWEWVIVDDHSRDDTFAVVQRLAQRDPRVRGIRLARNSGSHIAITCGLHHVRGEAALMMASDLQDPPETIGRLLERWRAGAHVVWAVRRERPGDVSHAGFAALYYWIMRNVVGMKEMPSRGADFFLIDRRVIEAFCRVRERNTSVFALITWLGFRQDYVEYDKQPRAAGRSGWTVARKITLVVDSVTGFSEAPIRFCSYVGVALLGAAVVTALARLIWPFGVATLLLSAMVALTGLQLLALGIVGEYVWRALDEARQRPAYFIEQYAGEPVPGEAVIETR
jgi:glycosyltransferase involved in cell wall biosynthesis